MIYKLVREITPKSTLGLVLIGMAIAFVIWFYQWTVRSSGGFNSPGEEDYYNFMVRGWREGHLHISKEPSSQMLALTDPYNPDLNRDVRLADASYFNNRYYLYFGAAPAAILMLPYDLITGRELGTTNAIYVFCVIGFLASTGLWLALRKRYFPASSIWIGPLGVLVLGLGTHVLALERRPLVWELPISMAYAFSTLALAGIYAALHGKKTVLAMGIAGFFLGLAVGARPTYIFCALMFLPALWQMRRPPRIRHQWMQAGIVELSRFGGHGDRVAQ